MLETGEERCFVGIEVKIAVVSKARLGDEKATAVRCDAVMYDQLLQWNGRCLVTEGVEVLV